MNVQDASLQVKRLLKKKTSLDIAIKLKTFVENNFPEDKEFLKKMNSQICCSAHLLIMSNDVIKTQFCKQKTCLVCNSIRLAKFLDKYLERIDENEIKYHMVLSIKNPDDDNLKSEIDKMFNFFSQSSIKRNVRYRELNKVIKFIRSFESTLNAKAKSFNIHFHILLAGQVEIEVKEYGEILIEYWLKYFGKKANRKAQYLELQERSLLENFKYLVKIKDIDESNIYMFYKLLKVTDNRHLFTAKNFEKLPSDELKESKFDDVKNEKVISLYSFFKFNWYDEETGEILVTDEKMKEYKNDLQEIKNYRSLKKYFSNLSI